MDLLNEIEELENKIKWLKCKKVSTYEDECKLKDLIRMYKLYLSLGV